MSDNTKIEWTDATWNPVTGCDRVSPGCDHCYALTLAERFRGTPGHYFESGFDVQLRPAKLDQPLRWKKPRKVFVNSMSDLFHEAVPDEYIARVFAVMALAPRHTFQVLTKRHGRMRSLLRSGGFHISVLDQIYRAVVDEIPELTVPDAACSWYWDQRSAVLSRQQASVTHWPLPNVWLGVSAEDQKWADIRIPALLDTPAAVRFVSAEPLLGPIDFFRSSLIDRDPSLDWVIVGGESGRGARPMLAEWVRSIRDQLQPSTIAFHFKQWGTHGGTPKSARELDGRTWDEFPEVTG